MPLSISTILVAAVPVSGLLQIFRKLILIGINILSPVVLRTGLGGALLVTYTILVVSIVAAVAIMVLLSFCHKN